MLDQEVAESLMLRAFAAAQNSTCARRRVGAIISDKDGNVVSYGFNHASNGISCESKFFSEFTKDTYPETAELKMFLDVLQTNPVLAHTYEEILSPELFAVWEAFKAYTKTPEFKLAHKKWQDTEIHSELSAIFNAYKEGKEVKNCILFSSRSPCVACAHAIIESGISMVYYTELSQAGEGGIPVLEQAGIAVQHLEVDHNYYT